MVSLSVTPPLKNPGYAPDMQLVGGGGGTEQPGSSFALPTDLPTPDKRKSGDTWKKQSGDSTKK